MTQRLNNWDLLAVEWAMSQIGRPFLWGETDCASLVRGMLLAMYGEEPFGDTPPYRDHLEALEIIRSRGSVLEHLVRIGATPHALPFAQTGDVCVAPGDGDFDSVSPIVAGRLLVTMPGECISTVPLWQAPEQATCYRVPHAW